MTDNARNPDTGVPPHAFVTPNPVYCAMCGMDVEAHEFHAVPPVETAKVADTTESDDGQCNDAHRCHAWPDCEFCRDAYPGEA